MLAPVIVIRIPVNRMARLEANVWEKNVLGCEYINGPTNNISS
jgi:hypothetical protein